MRVARNIGSFPICLSLLMCSEAALAQGISGTWSITEQVNATACGEGVYPDTYTAIASQDGNSVTVSAGAKVRSGALNGNTLSFTTSYPEDGGTLSSSGSLLFNNGVMSGQSQWTWTSGAQSCSGSSTISGTLTAAAAGAVPAAPHMAVSTSGNTVTASWDAVQGAERYTLFYAPYPEQSPVASMDVGAQLTVSAQLPTGSSFYLAVQAHNASGDSEISNITQFSIKEASAYDIVEIANEKSSLAAAVYDSSSAMLIFNAPEGSVLAKTLFRFSDGTQMTLNAKLNAQPTSFELAGYRFDYTFGSSKMTTRITNPDGSVTERTDPDPFYSSNAVSFAVKGGCDSAFTCALEESRGDLLAQYDEQKLEEAFNRVLQVMRRTPFTALGCHFLAPASTCEALSDYIDEVLAMTKRINSRSQQKIAHLTNTLKCTVSEEACAAVLVSGAPKVAEQISELKYRDSAFGGFEVDAQAVKPISTEWQHFFTFTGYSMTETPCSESVFADVRPECNGSGSPSDVDIPETIAYTTRSQMAGLCSNLGLDLQNDPSSMSVYCTLKGTHTGSGPYFEFRSDGTPIYGVNYKVLKIDGSNTVSRVGPQLGWNPDGSVNLETQYVNGQQHGPFKSYTVSGILEAQGQYENGKREGVWKYFQNSTLLREDTYSNNVKISSVSYGGGSNYTYLLSCGSATVCAEYEFNSQSQYNSTRTACLNSSSGSNVTEGALVCRSGPNCSATSSIGRQTTYVYNQSLGVVQNACISSGGIFSAN